MMALRAMPGRHHGVTLLELLIVLTLMALIAAMVLPMFSGGVSGTDLKTAARDVAAGLRLARDRAISQRAESLLELNLEARTFRVSPDERSHRLPEKIELKLYTAQRDLLNEKVGAIRFFPDGGSNGGRITLAAGERKYDVDVDWLTGRVAILPSITILRSARALRFIDEKVPGISVPAAIIERVEAAPDQQEACFDVAYELAQHAMAQPGVRGLHFISFRKDAGIAALCRRLGIPTHAERVEHGYGSPVPV